MDLVAPLVALQVPLASRPAIPIYNWIMHPGHQLTPPQFQENETVTWVADENVKVLPLTPFTVISELYVAGADAKQVA